jgi:hypothetical protein
VSTFGGVSQHGTRCRSPMLRSSVQWCFVILLGGGAEAPALDGGAVDHPVTNDQKGWMKGLGSLILLLQGDDSVLKKGLRKPGSNPLEPRFTNVTGTAQQTPLRFAPRNEGCSAMAISFRGGTPCRRRHFFWSSQLTVQESCQSVVCKEKKYIIGSLCVWCGGRGRAWGVASCNIKK